MILRLVGFLTAGYFGYLFILHNNTVYLLSTLLSFLGFLLAVNVHIKTKKQKSFYEKMLFVNLNEKQVVENGINGFNDGNQYRSIASMTDDLDIFGQRSLFHLLNRTTTAQGRDKLADFLTNPLQDGILINKYQQAVKTLSTQVTQRQELTAGGLLLVDRDGNLQEMSNWLQASNGLRSPTWILIVRWGIISYNLATLYYYLFSGHITPLIAGVAISWVLTQQFSKTIASQHAQVSKKHLLLKQYADILQKLHAFTSSSSELIESLQADSQNAHLAILRLGRIASLFDQRLNKVVYWLLNSLILYDIYCMISLDKWIWTNKHEFARWMEAVGSIECLNSLGAFAYNNPEYAFPMTVSDGQLIICAEQLAHPLIEQKNRVPNSIEIGKPQTMLVVTGSNMSGKTTFLRTLGVNMVLAQCGAPVCASSFIFSPMYIVSSMRISDSLQEHTSYFMAELLRLKQIIQQLELKRPCLVLIDEILRGTNSEDKRYGSNQYIKKLIQYKCLGLFATHDLSLSELETEFPTQIANVCFESKIASGMLSFDYKLRHGVAKNKNASFLMEKMGII